jgi:diacylglycerol kinase (ATP)
MRVVIVHNARAGNQQYDGDSLVRLISRAGHDAAYFTVHDTSWKGAVGDFAEIVAAAGGDGTVEEVARAVAGRRLPIAVLPLGTANNISRALGQVNIPIEDLVAGWADARRQPFDIGLARGPWETFRFVESVGAGLLADGMAEIREGRADDIRQAGDADGRLAAARGLFHRRLGRTAPLRFNLTLDGRDLSGDYLLLEVLNFGAAGPNLRLAPHAGPSDGLLDVVLVDERHRRQLADHFLSSRITASTPALPVYQGRHATLSCGGCNLHLDDEVWGGQPAGPDAVVIDLSVEPKALTFLVGE